MTFKHLVIVAVVAAITTFVVKPVVTQVVNDLL